MPRTFPEVSTCTFCPRVNIFGALLSHLRSLRNNEPVSTAGFFLVPLSVCLLLLVSSVVVQAQNTTATLTGTLTDQSGAVVPGVNVTAISITQNFQRSAMTNEEGTYVIPALPPGEYRVKVEREGFLTRELRNVILNVNAYTRVNISLRIGELTQNVEVLENPSLIDETPSVGARVDAKLIQMPLNGRSFQQLLNFVPGILITKATAGEQGQFSVNGQRANANYFSIDGVSANIAVPTSASGGEQASGSLPGLSASGGTNNLVSIDALQEFKVETSSYGAEFGRTPGAQVIIATRPGTNVFHGSLFEYFRNDVLDANDWFANSRGQGRSALRQNEFGGVVGGPILLPRFGEGGKQPWYNGKDHTFFFFSYEGLRLRQPSFLITQVPSLAARQAAPAGLQPFLNAFPRPTGPALASNFAEFAAGFSNPTTFDSTGIRIDHHVSDKLTFFGRYNDAPSNTIQRAVISTSLNTLDTLLIDTKTMTGGATLLLSPATVVDVRANYSHNGANRSFSLDSFGGASVPDDSLMFPSFASPDDSSFSLTIIGGRNAAIRTGRLLDNVQRQLNVVGSLQLVTGSHDFKVGVDFRRMNPSLAQRKYGQTALFSGMNNVLLGRAISSSVQSLVTPLVPVYLNYSFYGQDNWRISKRLSLTYGLRNEINPPPTEADGKVPATLVQIVDPRTFQLSPTPQPLWKTTYFNFAPRIGLNFQLSRQPGRETALRGGYGIFFDQGNGVGGQVFLAAYPYLGTRSFPTNSQFPFTSSVDITPPAPGGLPISQLFVFDPDLKLPYTHQWNFAVEQSLGKNQTVSTSYVAAVGRRLLRQETFGGATLAGNPIFQSFSQVFVTWNRATSDYHALQLKFQRRLVNNLQVLSHYTWSHSLDNASNESAPFAPSLFIDPNEDRSSSDFDIRHNFSLALSYDLPRLRTRNIGEALLRNWTIQTFVTARSAPPVNVVSFRDLGFGAFNLRPDLIENQPLYISDSNVGGGKRFNPAAFRVPTQLRQGSLGRNVLRGFPLFQTDLGVSRSFPIREKFSIEFKAEVFNLFNHPNFGNPDADVTNVDTFGKSFRMLGRDLGSGGTLGGLSPLYQVGGPRSIQLSLRAQF
jgi:hypothetical protein